MRSLTHVYYGYGKGKTTAALGLALRACGSGRNVVIVQFLKDTPTGELKPLALLPNVTLLRGTGSVRFTYKMRDEEKLKTKRVHDANLARAISQIKEDKYDMLILDEALDACHLGLVDEALIRDLVCNKPDGVELVITGHTPISWVMEKADYVTEMRKLKHPYDKGIKARKGIEF